MIQFIFLFPLIYFLIKKYDHKGVMICFAVNFLYEILKNAYEMNEECYRLLVFRYIFLIAIGSYIAVNKRPLKLKYSILMLCCGIVYIVIFKYMKYTPVITNYWSGTSMFAVLFIIPIVAFLITNTNTHFKPVEILGKASYNIFLVQMVYYLAASHVYNKVENRLVQLIISIILCTIIGTVYYYIEAPITKWLVNKIKSL